VPTGVPAVLIIDDAVFSEEDQDQVLFTKLRELLSNELLGFEFVLADTWNDGTSRIRASEILTSDRRGNKRIRLVLLDLDFGEEQSMQGDQILGEIRPITAGLVPVVILTIDRPELPQPMVQRLTVLGAAGWQSKDSIRQGHFDESLRSVLQKVTAEQRLRVIDRDREMLLQIVDGFDRPLFPGDGIPVPWPVDTVLRRCATNPDRRVSFTDEDLLIIVGKETPDAVQKMSKLGRRSKVVEGKLRSCLSKEISKFNDKLKEKGLTSTLVVKDGVKGRTAKRLSISEIEISTWEPPNSGALRSPRRL